MKKFRFTINTLAVLVFTLALVTVAQAQAARTWVSGVGDDVNPCSRTAPCRTFAGSISKTAQDGEMNCLDPGSFGTVTIAKSITIDCHEVFAGILSSGTNGINIPFDSFAPGDSRKTVRLRNLNINGNDTGSVGVNITGPTATGTKVFIEDCLIDGNFGGTARGILDFRAAGGALVINNTTVRSMGSSGISVVPVSGSNGPNVTITNSRVANCTFGVAVANGIKVTISGSVFVSNNTGIRADGLGSVISVDHCVVSNNAGTGFVANDATIFVSFTVAMNNLTLATIGGTGIVSSYGNNQTGGVAFPSTGTNPT
jgi:hypothetical protein